jgi:hypothetical protein
MRHALLCYAEGQEDTWQAICVDLDIAVQGTSLEQVYLSLNQAIGTYIKDAVAESPSDRERLLARRAPLLVRWGYAFRVLMHNLFRGGDGGDRQALFELACPA